MFKWNRSDTMLKALGQAKKDIIDDTSSHSGRWFVLEAITDVTFTSLTDSTIESGSMAGKTLYAGHIYRGDITALQLSSGSLFAYRGE